MRSDAPPYAYNFRALAARADDELRRRQNEYGAAIEAGSITPEAAAADTDAWRAIAAEWRWVALRQETPAVPHVALTAREKAIAEAVRRSRGKARQAYVDFLDAHEEAQSESMRPIDAQATLATTPIGALPHLFGSAIAPYLHAFRRYECLVALHWWSKRTGEDSILALADTTDRLRTPGQPQRRAA